MNFFHSKNIAFVYIFLILICYFCDKNKKKLVPVYNKNILLCKKREKITSHEEKSQRPPPPPPGYQMVLPLGLLKQTYIIK